MSVPPDVYICPLRKKRAPLPENSKICTSGSLVNQNK